MLVKGAISDIKCVDAITTHVGATAAPGYISEMGNIEMLTSCTWFDF